MAPAAAILGGARRAVSLTNTSLHLSAAGPTFAGRDIFAPVAAHLSNGMDLTEVGDLVDPAGLLPGIVPLTRVEDGVVHGEVLWVDRFGNAQLNVDPNDIVDFGAAVTLTMGSVVRTAKRADTYGSIRGSEIGLVVDSYGLVSVCLDRQSASRELGLAAGMAIDLSEPTDGPGGPPSMGVVTPVQLGPRRAD